MIVVVLLVVIPLRGRVAELRERIALLQRESEEMRSQEAVRAKELQDQIALLKDELVGVPGGGSMAGANSPIVLRDAGRQLVLDEDGKLSGVDSLPVAYQQMIREALTSQRIRFVAVPLSSSAQAGIRLGGPDAGESFRLLAPLRTAVLSDRPTFRWEPLKGAEVYRVFVRDLARDTEVESEPTTETNWTPREPLARGHVYSWAVEAVKDGRRIHAPSLKAPNAEFKVLEAEKADDLARARKSGSHLVLALLYARYGLAAEARAELKALQQANPRSQLVSKLINRLGT
jgi:hypothetical protein